MARPLKRGLAYFPLDTDLFGNRKILRILDKYGCESIAVYLSALCEIYSSEGYYILFDQNLCFDIGFTLRLDEKRVKEILTFCVQIRLFDEKLLKEHQVLSSAGIQRRYVEVNKRYGKKHIDPNFVLDEKVGGIATKTTVFDTKTHPKEGVLVEKEGVLSAKTPTKGKGKGNNIKKEKIKKEKKYETEPEQMSSRDEDARRQAELRKMLEAATTNQ